MVEVLEQHRCCIWVSSWLRMVINLRFFWVPVDKDLLQLEEFVKYGEVYTTTEDGSHGEKGYVTQHSILNKVRFEQIYTCGPKPMMVAVAKYAKSNQIECEVSLENTMACGIGACLCCVENTTEGHLCVCKEGPVFNINKLLWQI